MPAREASPSLQLLSVLTRTIDLFFKIFFVERVCVMKTTTSLKIVSLLLVLLLCPTVFAPFAVDTAADGGDVSVSITWTDMSFTYVDGAWDPTTHTYAAGTWQPKADGGKITVANTGTTSMKFSFSYTSDMSYSSIGGQFSYNGSAVSSVNVAPNTSSVVSFTPTGKPSGAINNAKIGSITVSVSQTAGTASININGKPLNTSNKFYIVYSDSDIYGAKVFAHRLLKLLTSYGCTGVSVIEDNTSAKANEIVVGNTNRGTKNTSSTAYSLITNGGKLYIRSPKSVGYDYIYNSLDKEFSAASVNGMKLNYTNGDTYTKELSAVLDGGSEAALGKTGDIRIMFNNVWIFATLTDGDVTYKGPVNYRANQLAAVYRDYMPDVLGLQEFGDQEGLRSALKPLLTNLGYTEVSYSNNTNGQTALFYNKNTVTCVASGYLDFPKASNGIDQGERGVAWGVFKDKATGNQFIVGSTHFVWADPASYTTAQVTAARVANANSAATQMQNLYNTYRCPVFLGGDFNSRLNNETAAPHHTLASKGFTNVVHLATKAEAQNTHHRYPSFTDSDCLADEYYTGTYTSSYTNALDHIFAYQHSSIQCNTQAVINDFLAITSSDHDPVLLDFSFSQDSSSGKK